MTTSTVSLNRTEHLINGSSTSSRRRQVVFFGGLVVLISAAVLRSNIATRLDGFCNDEPYHITSGVSYVRTGDYRLNPEHPPLVKLWVGAAFPGDAFELEEFRPLMDKNEERAFTETTVYLKNEPDRVQQRARIAMFALNALLLLALALAVRRAFNDVVAIAAVAFLVIDPTVAAHLAVVMTDLPVALLSITAILFAVAAFRGWRVSDLILTSLFLGLTLGVKHSGLVTFAVVAVFGAVMAVAFPTGKDPAARLRRAGILALVLLGSMCVLWSLYCFRFNESPVGRDLFNRPLAAKINDLNSPLIKAALPVISEGHLLPRAYTWGLADTIRTGFEGRADSLCAFGQLYYSKTPLYLVPAMLLVRLPLGLILLVAVGLALVILKKIPAEWRLPTGVSLAFAGVYLFVLGNGSSFGGIRHALPAVPPLAVLGGLAAAKAIETRSRALVGVVAAGVLAALASAVPVVRPWEYYNELVGTANAYRYFADEGIDLVLRGRELADYYHRHLEPSGIVPHLFYPLSRQERIARGIHWIGEDPSQKVGGDPDVFSGTLFVSARRLTPRLWWGFPSLREEKPVARLGNLFIFSGTFHLPTVRATNLYYDAMDALYSSQPDRAKAEQMLSETVELHPRAFFAAIELGNLHAGQGSRERAIRAYEIAKAHAPTAEIVELLERQIELISKGPPESVRPLRNPEAE